MIDKSSTFAPNFKFSHMERATMYRTPEAYIADIEIMTGKSYGTAKRIMAKIKRHFGISMRNRPTLDQVKEYLCVIERK